MPSDRSDGHYRGPDGAARPCPTSTTNSPRSQLRPARVRRNDAALLRGRACFERQEWDDAFEALARADAATPLGAEDLHRLAWSAGLSARDEQMLATQERVYHARLEAGEALAAARAAFWLGFRLLARGEAARASGWLSRAQRLVDATARTASSRATCCCRPASGT